MRNGLDCGISTRRKVNAVNIPPAEFYRHFKHDAKGNTLVSGSGCRKRQYFPVRRGSSISPSFYLYTLGSASVLTDASGAPVTDANVRYFPFGEARPSNINVGTAPMLTDKLFTGQRLIADLGIYHYGARFYSPKLGRFLSADTIVSSFANPQNLNRYSYGLNNPLRYTDPSGHSVECALGEQYCEAGTLNVQRRAIDRYLDIRYRDRELGRTTLWEGLTDEDRSILSEANWSSGDFNAEEGVTDVGGTAYDPAVYISLAAGGWASGLVSDIGWMGLSVCLRVTACARTIAGTTGITVYRVWGGNPNQPGINYSGPYGSSWSPIPPHVAERLFSTTYRNVAGLPNINNMGRFLSTGTINDISVVSRIQTATPISPNSGGLLEYIIYNAQNVVNLTRIQGINPPY